MVKTSFLTALLVILVPVRADEASIHSISIGKPVVASPALPVSGDTWMPAWAANGSIYSPANDTDGFANAGSSNIGFNRILGAPPSLQGQTVNIMADYGHAGQAAADGCTWKSSGCLALDGILYWFVARHRYGETSGDVHMRQPAHNGSLIKSSDGGHTWTRSAEENYDHPLFPGRRFAAAYFVNYGRDGQLAVVDGSDRYVYALSNNGFWDNGDDMILGRVGRAVLPRLTGVDWQFYTGGDGALSASWTSDLKRAAPVVKDPDRLGMTGAVYLPAQHCYLMIDWFYPAGGGKLPQAHTTTVWNFQVADHPWGPWRSVGCQTFSPQGYYCPEVCPKFTSPDGRQLWVFTAGDWTNSAVYRLAAVPITLH